MYCLESKISKQVPLTRKLYCVPRIDDAELIRKLNAANTLGYPAHAMRSVALNFRIILASVCVL